MVLGNRKMNYHVIPLKADFCLMEDTRYVQNYFKSIVKWSESGTVTNWRDQGEFHGRGNI